jgi:hypothetical protein
LKILSSQVSRLWVKLDEQVGTFLDRSLEGDWPCLCGIDDVRLQTLVAAAKARPGALNHGSSGICTSCISGLQLWRFDGVDSLHVPVRGSVWGGLNTPKGLPAEVRGKLEADEGRRHPPLRRAEPSAIRQAAPQKLVDEELPVVPSSDRKSSV